MKGYTPPEYAYASEIVWHAIFRYLVSKAKYWYTHISVRERDTTLRLRTILTENIDMIYLN